MSAWSEVRRLARLRHDELSSSPEHLVPAASLLEAAEAATRVHRRARPAGDTLLEGAEAAYDRERSRIYYSRDTEPRLANFYIAHEFGHHWLHEPGAACDTADFDPAAPSEASPSLVGDADAYSPKERREAQANVFAREFLLPRDKLKRRCAFGGFDADDIAAELCLPVDLVMQQLAEALLLPEEVASESHRTDELPPDTSQLKAINAGRGPRQVRAGPGTGKTRTLVGRVANIVANGEDPASILALTYSNAAAQDLAGRIRAAIGEKAAAVWSGTFHAYGLELLRKYGSNIGLPITVRLLDRSESLFLLEELLPELPLHHYLDLYEPVLKLRSILSAIGRAKDELVTPADYHRLASDMLAVAAGPKSIEAADRAVEVARIYDIYERTLRSRGCVDFGDLIALPIELLRAHPNIRATIRGEKRHILVDEYQDMNRASAYFLRELVEPGQGPWVVGDVRQAIYRFRGASPLNMSRFADDFPGAQADDLSVNYRSGGRIIRTFETFGSRMETAALASADALKAHRGEGVGEVVYEIAATREAEAHGIASTIQARVRAGDRFGNHAILGRSHTTLSRLALHLEKAGVPCLYFGDFFERPEIRDLLALISVVGERQGVGLLRVAQMPQYAVPPADIDLVFRWRREQRIPMLAALQRSAEIDGISDAGRAGLNRLADDIADVDWPTSPHRFLMFYLFRRCDHVLRLTGDETVAGQQRRLAVYQLLLFAFSFKAPADTNPKRAFLEHIRRLEILDEDKQLRQLPSAATNIDAVRLMTVHASKGLEFPIVHIPALTTRHFPLPARSEACPPPDGMISSDALLSRAAEEESLFFVGLSRARDTLILSRALMTGKLSTKNPSRFLEHIQRHLPKGLAASAGWSAHGPVDPPWPALQAPPPPALWTAWAIEVYLGCPRRYYYDQVLVLGGSEESSPYLRFQSALRASIAWMRAAASAAERRAGLAARFEEDWITWGPHDHPLARFYRAAAERMITNAAAAMEGDSLPVERSVKLPITGAVVTCQADHIQTTGRGIVIQRLKTSRLAKSETPKAKYAVLQAAVRNDHPGEDVVFEHVSLLNGDRASGTIDSRKLEDALSSIESAILAIADGTFDPKPGDRCPTCPYFFICPCHGALR